MSVIYDLKKSNYYTDYRGLRFYFSSPCYQRKFETKINDYVEDEAIKLSAKFKIPVGACKFYCIFAVALYRKIEKRGERIEDKNGHEYKLG